MGAVSEMEKRIYRNMNLWRKKGKKRIEKSKIKAQNKIIEINLKYKKNKVN